MKKHKKNYILTFRSYAFYECSFYTEPCDGELIWCTHQANDSLDEGNCQPIFCPILKEIHDLIDKEQRKKEDESYKEYSGYQGDMNEKAPRLF